jgi:starvation-inducible outer membrane lipoprotein
MLRNIWLCAIALASIVIFAGCRTAPQPLQKSGTAADIQAFTALREQFTTTHNFHNTPAANHWILEGRQPWQRT